VEKTCILVKPDGVCKNLTGTIFARFAKAGLELRAAKMFKLSTAQAEQFYGEHKGKPFYDPLITFMTSAPIVATVWEGEEAIAKARAVMGATNSPEAAAGTIRKEYGTNNRYNVVHGSDSISSAEREVKFFFKPEEIYMYHENDWKV
jgi:nucleoside-diphosphate kinase